MAVFEPIHGHLDPLPPVDRRSVLSYLQWVSSAIRAYEQSLSLLDQMDRLVDEAFPASPNGRVAARCDFGLARGHTLSQSGDFETAAVELDRVAALIPDTIDGLKIKRGLGQERTWLAFERADWTGVLDHAATTAPLYGPTSAAARASENPKLMAEIDTETGWIWHGLGETDRARACFEAAHGTYASIGHGPKQAQLAGYLDQIDGRRD